MLATEAAEIIGCTVQHIRSLVRDGKLEAEWTPGPGGGYWNVDRDSVYRYKKETVNDGRSMRRKGYRPDTRKGK